MGLRRSMPQPGESVTLWNMIEFTHASRLIELSAGMYAVLGGLSDDDRRAWQDFLDIVGWSVEKMAEVLEELEELGLARRVERFRQRLDEGNLSSETIRYEANGILDQIKYQLDERLTLLAIEPRDRDYFRAPHLSPGAASCYPAAKVELTEAGKCLALGRHTASVFHAMRAIEPVLQHLANIVGAEVRPSWGPTLGNIEIEIKKVQAGGKPHLNDLKGVLSQATTYILGFKDAYRNETMHAEKSYGREGAESVFRSVRDLVELGVTLATSAAPQSPKSI